MFCVFCGNCVSKSQIKFDNTFEYGLVDKCEEPKKILPMLPVVTNDILARRLKNRERQRRYRARKRLESDIKKSCLVGQHAALQSETQFKLTTIQLNSCELSFPSDMYPNFTISRSEARVYSGRKWKRDAREAHVSKQSESPLSWSPLPMRSPSEYGTTLHIYPAGRRNWKADARNKMRDVSHEGVY